MTRGIRYPFQPIKVYSEKFIKYLESTGYIRYSPPLFHIR